MYTTEYVVRQFSKTPLKHRMSRYLLEKILKDEDLLQRIEFVAARDHLPNTMLVAQTGYEGPGFELELGAVETEHITIVNDRLVKKSARTARCGFAIRRAAEVLANFKGKPHVQFALRANSTLVSGKSCHT